VTKGVARHGSRRSGPKGAAALSHGADLRGVRYGQSLAPGKAGAVPRLRGAVPAGAPRDVLAQDPGPRPGGALLLPRHRHDHRPAPRLLRLAHAGHLAGPGGGGRAGGARPERRGGRQRAPARGRAGGGYLTHSDALGPPAAGPRALDPGHGPGLAARFLPELSDRRGVLPGAPRNGERARGPARDLPELLAYLAGPPRTAAPGPAAAPRRKRPPTIPWA
jgi:hypothetical protein